MFEFLTQHGYRVIQAYSGDVGIQMILGEKPDLVILDIMLPNFSGIEVCKAVRSAYRGIIIMVTAQDDDESEIESLTLGVDDFIRKPVNPDILLLRANKLLTMTSVDSNKKVLNYGNLKLDLVKFEVFLSSIQIDISQSDFKLLAYLAENADKIMSREQIYTDIKGIEYNGLDRSIDNKISHLRKILGDDPKKPERIRTVWGKGYLFCSDAW